MLQGIDVIVGAAAAERRLVPAPVTAAADSLQSQNTTTASAGVTTTTGVKQTTDFLLRGARDIRGRVLVQGRWTIAGAGADGTARLNATLLRNGVAIAGVTVANGPARSFAAGGSFRETLAIQCPNNLDLALNDELTLRLTIEVTVAGTGNRDIAITHDPATAANRLLVEGLD